MNINAYTDLPCSVIIFLMLLTMITILMLNQSMICLFFVTTCEIILSSGYNNLAMGHRIATVTVAIRFGCF